MRIARDIYLEKLKRGIGNGMIKVITGIRRCGKSYLLSVLFREYLASIGVDEPHIIEAALDDRANAALRDPDAMMAYVKSRITDSGRYFILSAYANSCWTRTALSSSAKRVLRRECRRPCVGGITRISQLYQGFNTSRVDTHKPLRYFESPEPSLPDVAVLFHDSFTIGASKRGNHCFLQGGSMRREAPRAVRRSPRHEPTGE